jgi:hypothetical protein
VARDRPSPLAPTAATPARWILFLPAIPPKPPSLRIRVWRRLQAIGAVGLRGSLYVLPNREECVELFAWVARELAESGGQASLCEAHFLDVATDDEIERRLRDARGADYAELAKQAKRLLAAARGKRAVAALADAHARLTRRLAAVVAIDFLGAPGREAVEGLLAAISTAMPRDGGPPPAPLTIVPRPQAATWVTRTGVHVDRIASAWLIRRFIDPAARFKFVAAKGYVPRPGEQRFDMFDAEFTHVGDRCTFEVLLARMGLDDVALTALAEVIHDLDLRDARYGRVEAPGVASMIDGVCTVARSDDERIAVVTPMLDGLYAHFSLAARRPTARRKASPATTRRPR